MATNQPTDRVLAAQSVGADLGDGFYVLPGMGNALVAETDDGLVLVDAGSQFTTPGMIEPVSYTHLTLPTIYSV